MEVVSQSHNFSLPEGDDLHPFNRWESELEKSLLGPLRSYASSNSKKLRAKLLFLSSMIAQQSDLEHKQKMTPQILGLTEVIEAIHAGSIIIDDIQDDAGERRGEQALFRQIGAPLAINAGTWLYFWALKKINRLGLSPETEIEIHRLCHDALFWAHFGQALDLNAKAESLDQVNLSSYAKTAIELKTGSLTSLAAELGAIGAGAGQSVREALRDFGRDFGVILQSCNDLSEFSKKPNGVSRDLLLGRPTWVFAAAAETLSTSDYENFKDQVLNLRNLDETQALLVMEQIKNHKVIVEARRSARSLLVSSFENLRLKLDKYNPGATSTPFWRELEMLGETMLAPYAP